MIPPPPSSTLFPYTTLFRSHGFDERKRGDWHRPGLQGKRKLHSLHPAPRPRAQLVARVTRVGHEAVERSEEHTSELQSQFHLVCRHLLEKKNVDFAGDHVVG